MEISRIDGKWILKDKESEEIDIYKLVYNIKKYEVIDAYHPKDKQSDLEIVVQKVSYVNGEKRVRRKNVIFKDYFHIKKLPGLLELEQDIEKGIERHSIRKLRQLIPKLVVAPTAFSILLGGVKLVSTPKDYENFKDVNAYIIQESIENTMPLAPTINNDIVNEVKKGIELEINSSIVENNNESQDKYIYDTLKWYCDVFEFDDELFSRIYDTSYIDILNSNNMEESIMMSVYNYYTKNLYLELYTEPNGYTEDEMETYIVKFANVLGIYDDELLYTMLSVHELETGHGTSELCLESNNLGGNTFVNPETGELEFQHYPNAIVGAMGFTIDFVRIYKATLPLEYQNQDVDWSMGGEEFSIEYFMNPMYCTEKMEEDDPEWYQIVSDIKGTLKENKRLDEVKQMISDLDNYKGKSY